MVESDIPINATTRLSIVGLNSCGDGVFAGSCGIDTVSDTEFLLALNGFCGTTWEPLMPALTEKSRRPGISRRFVKVIPSASFRCGLGNSRRCHDPQLQPFLALQTCNRGGGAIAFWGTVRRQSVVQRARSGNCDLPWPRQHPPSSGCLLCQDGEPLKSHGYETVFPLPGMFGCKKKLGC